MQGRRDWPGAELADRLEVSGRTVRRDVERLRRLGYPIESLTGPAGGYRLSSGTAMPPLLLDDEEAIAIAVGLRTAAQSAVAGIEETSVRALVKLEQVLPKHLRRRVQALGQVASGGFPGNAPTVDPQDLTVTASACRDGERLRFEYEARDGVGSRRLVEPLSLVNLGRRWYLVAWDSGREDWRTFRLDRMRRPAAAGGRCAERSLPGGVDPAAYVEGNLSGAPQRYDARVTVHCAAGDLADRPWLRGSVEPLSDTSCELRTSEDDLDWLAVKIAMLGHDFDVHEPPELIGRLAALRDRIAGALPSA
jgi:predicted DNA-binding transcriptional regulator YafY